MINVNQITSQLAKLPDQALQQYAALNKNDPYIMALAVAESNRRKELRTAAQSAQGAPQQAPVVDEVVQGMAAPMPEESGIAQLPAGSMDFANGGIVAFADGGDVERYQVGGVLAGTEYEIPGMLRPTTPFMPQRGDEEQTPWLQRQMEAFMTYAREQPAEQARARIAAGYGSKADVELLKRAAQRETTPPVLTGPKTTLSERSQALQNMDPRDRRLAAATASSAPAVFRTPSTYAPSSTPAPAPAPAPAGNRVVPTAGLGAAAAARAPQQGFSALDPLAMFKRTEKSLNDEERPEKRMLEELTAEKTKAAEADLASTKERTAKYADAYKGRRERLEGKEAELGGMKDQNLGLALLQAGAAMMSTPGGIGAALGKGIDTGSRQYIAGLDKLNAAKEKIADARDRLEELQLNRDEMSDREIAAAEKGVRTAGLEGREKMIQFVMDTRNVNRTTAAAIVSQVMELGIAQLREAGADRRANASLAAAQNAPDRQYYAAMLQKYGDPIKAQEAMVAAKAKAQAESFNFKEAYLKYMTDRKDTLEPMQTFDQFMAKFGATRPR